MPDFENWNNEPPIDIEQGASSGRSRHTAPQAGRLASRAWRESAGLEARRRQENRFHMLAIGLVFIGVAIVLYIVLFRI